MKVALALSGGGVRAVAHLGVVKVLREHGIEISTISGSSGGALVGSLLCDGKSSEAILEIIQTVKLWDLTQRSHGHGLFGLQKIADMLRNNLSITDIAEAPTPFIVACTDLIDGEVHYFDRGPIVDLAIASSSLVPIFAPVSYQNQLLADGGLIDNLPAKPLQSLKLPIIGVNVNPILPYSPQTLFSTTVRALMLMMNANVEISKPYCDIYMEIKGCERINIFDLKRVDKAFQLGVETAYRMMPTIKAMLR
jgi:NTE family protein